MMNAKEAPRYKGFFKIFFFSLLAMVFGFLCGLGALKADALTSSKLAILRAHDRQLLVEVGKTSDVLADYGERER
ncbi:hypothetical protein EMIHUDRAFT_200577 [Emiliania huxleyi CCMP1516]|uniref:Uncharacterized protein n=2 Tax=Emiliania huxleyi TaxID=2903 RepID=A0A0D3KQT6_EMIH1|nr:hypothetical protein EMIHUDRAFT_200577 [Emiliania huxleyi CCMP1516]EOD38121.1 hypothetical protein EMIHUDRAFT_200577 [Emiliania huxleyi CCMP1516]|eukprot:XP_005790550.1 hypothetical protein EMIHUDRAFT_200577 [Emiliania huxleyi CCMP1516]